MRPRTKTFCILKDFFPDANHWCDLNSGDLANLILLCKIRDKSFVPLNLPLHFKLNDTDNNNSFLHSWPVKKLLSRGPNFGLKDSPSALKSNLLRDLNIFEYRVAKTLDRANRAKEILSAKEHSKSLGILQWKPCKVPYPADFFLKESKLIYKADNQQHHTCPELQSEMARLKSSVLSACDIIVDSLSHAKYKGRWGNLHSVERHALRQLKKMNLYYSLADKNLGPVLASRDLTTEQLKLHLYDEAGTYKEIENLSKSDLIQRGINNLDRLEGFADRQFSGLVKRFVWFAKWCSDADKLCQVFILWKLHKKPKDNGLESRLIAPNINYFTADVSTFLHYQLAPAVFSHPYVLSDSLSFCRVIELVNNAKLDWNNISVVTADVVALYPSIDIQDGLIALRWFLDDSTKFSPVLKLFIMELAKFVLENNFVEAKDIGSGIFQQVIGVPMGTSFSVVFSIIFMIWLEEPIIDRYSESILIYRRAIDDLIFFWKGSETDFENLKSDFNRAHKNIRFDWSNLSKSAIFLDLKLEFSKTSMDQLFVKSSVYCKPGNSFCYLQPDSFHPSHNFRGWIRGLLIRNLTRSNTIEDWRKENVNLFYRLRARGHTQDFLLDLFDSICWLDRAKFLEPKDKVAVHDNLIVLSTPLVSGFNAIRRVEDLSFAPFRNSAATRAIFPNYGTWVAKSAPKLGAILH